MQFSETFCKPSSCITVVPVGLPMILQYNQHGMLQRIMVGYDKSLEGHEPTDDSMDKEVYDKLFDVVKRHVPIKIATTGGTTWVYGVMYSDTIPTDDGVIPDALYNSYINDIISGNPYTFYAGYVHSLAASFRGPIIIRNFISTGGFNSLPQVIVPLHLTDATIEAAFNARAPFNKNFIAGFFVYEEMNCRYAPMGLKQFTPVKDPELYVAPDGTWHGTVTVKSGEQLDFSYSALIHHQVQKGSTVLMQEDSVGSKYILSTRIGSAAEILVHRVGEEVKCPVCRKLVRVGQDDGPIKCDDIHCLSHQYPMVQQMLNCFGLDDMPYEDYIKAVKGGEIICLTDVLELPQYKDKEIHTTLATAIYAVMDSPVDFKTIEKFANKCNNSIETVEYYLDNPLRIETDLDVVDSSVATFIKWLEDPYNISTLTSIFELVKIEEKVQKFDGAPIFRGNKIAITGRFKRGNYPEIEAILRSYAATVVTGIEIGDSLPDVVVVGAFNENISGQMIQKAKIHSIPIIDEDDFFTQYEIDQDMANNLL